jgi:hypothetical protein
VALPDIWSWDFLNLEPLSAWQVPPRSTLGCRTSHSPGDHVLRYVVKVSQPYPKLSIAHQKRPRY